MRGGAADQVPGSLRLPFPHSVARTPPQAPALTPLPQTCRHPGGPKVTAQGRATATAQGPGPRRRRHRHRHRVNKHHRGAPTPRPPWRPTPVSGPGARGGRQVPAVASSAASLGARSGALCPQDRPLAGRGPSAESWGRRRGLGTERPYPEPGLSQRDWRRGRRGFILREGSTYWRAGAVRGACSSAMRQPGARAGGARSRGARGRCGRERYKGAETRRTGGSSGAGEGAGEGWGQGQGAGEEGGPEMERGARGETARGRGRRAGAEARLRRTRRGKWGGNLQKDTWNINGGP